MEDKQEQTRYKLVVTLQIADKQGEKYALLLNKWTVANEYSIYVRIFMDDLCSLAFTIGGLSDDVDVKIELCLAVNGFEESELETLMASLGHADSFALCRQNKCVAISRKVSQLKNLDFF